MHKSSVGILIALGVWKSNISCQRNKLLTIFYNDYSIADIELSIVQEQQTMQSSFAYMLVVLVLNKLIFDFLNLWITTD